MNNLIIACRPKQWIKNLLVFAVPLASGDLLDREVFMKTVISAVAFTAISAATYLFNDISDVEEDRLHSTKKLRPIAAGTLTIGSARLVSGVLVLLSIGLVAGVGAWNLGLVLFGYSLLQVMYQGFLKKTALFDLVAVAAGFLLRAVAGGVASAILISPWFLTVTFCAALFMISGKRYSELINQGSTKGTRSALLKYSEQYLHLIWTSSMVMTIVFYLLWSVEIGSKGNGWLVLSTSIPFALAILLYAQHVDGGKAESPENVVFDDRRIQLMGGIWIILFALQAGV
jgi:decaprenyl-phosphate phosphoribosyltransferase